MDFDANGSPLERLVFGELEAGRLRQDSGGSDRRYLPGEVFLAVQSADSYISVVHSADLQLTVIDPGLPSQVRT